LANRDVIFNVSGEVASLVRSYAFSASA